MSWEGGKRERLSCTNWRWRGRTCQTCFCWVIVCASWQHGIEGKRKEEKESQICQSVSHILHTPLKPNVCSLKTSAKKSWRCQLVFCICTAAKKKKEKRRTWHYFIHNQLQPTLSVQTCTSFLGAHSHSNHDQMATAKICISSLFPFCCTFAGR